MKNSEKMDNFDKISSVFYSSCCRGAIVPVSFLSDILGFDDSHLLSLVDDGSVDSDVFSFDGLIFVNIFPFLEFFKSDENIYYFMESLLDHVRGLQKFNLAPAKNKFIF